VTTEADTGFMRAALGLAPRGLGTVWPNPAVGCVIVRQGRVVGRGWTQPGGRPHAETEALARAGAAARGATAYVTLEPCAHHGETPPCAQALIDAGLGRVVVALEDPDPRVDGGGIRMLREAGIATETGLCGPEAAALNAGFLRRVRDGRPMVTLKAATTLDGRIATRGGDSQWITGEAARAQGHLLRANHDAILIGAGTAMADDPELTCRLAGLEDRSPVRVVLDGRLRLPLTHRLVVGAGEVPTWLFAFAAGDKARVARRRAYVEAGVEVIDAEADESGNPDPYAVLAELARRGITRLLIEGGGRVAATFLAAGLIDEIVWFRAARIIGGDGVPVIAGFGTERLEEAVDAHLVDMRYVGEDVMERYRLRTAG